MLIRVRDSRAAGFGIAAAALGSWLLLWLAGVLATIVPIGLGLLYAAWRTGARLAERRSSALLSESRQALDAVRQQLAAAEAELRGSRQLTAIGRLTAGIAHDFNNQLTVISSNVEMLKRSPGAADGRLQRHADAAMQGVQRAAALTGRVLSLSRTASPEPEAVDVNRLLDSLMSLLQRGAGNRIALDLRLLPESWCVWADVNRLENALLALAAEAGEHVPDGGTLAVAADAVKLAAGGAGLLPGDYVRIEVTAAQAGRPAGDGAAGKALALAREAGGTVLPCDDPGSVRLLLPRYVPPPPTVPARRGAGRRATILVVEDDDGVRAACVAVLRGLDYEVLEAPDAMEGFRLIADGGGIDLLFTDIGLPGGVSGRALADAVRQLDGGVRVVFTTGYGAAGLPHCPGTALLPKPYGPAQLSAAVREALETRLSAAG